MAHRSMHLMAVLVVSLGGIFSVCGNAHAGISKKRRAEYGNRKYSNSIFTFKEGGKFGQGVLLQRALGFGRTIMNRYDIFKIVPTNRRKDEKGTAIVMVTTGSTVRLLNYEKRELVGEFNVPNVLPGPQDAPSIRSFLAGGGNVRVMSPIHPGVRITVEDPSKAKKPQGYYGGLKVVVEGATENPYRLVLGGIGYDPPLTER